MYTILIHIVYTCILRTWPSAGGSGSGCATRSPAGDARSGRERIARCVCVYMYHYIYIYICIHTFCICICIYIYIHTHIHIYA